MSAIAKAMVAAQGKMPHLRKDTKGQEGNRTYTYLSLDTLLAQVLPVLNAEGLALMQTVCVHEMGAPALRTHLVHESGESHEDVMLLPVDPGAGAKALGSAITYARRYALLAMLALAPDEDDDGAKAGTRVARGNGAESAQEAVTQPARSGAEGTPMTPGQKREIHGLIEALEQEMPSTLRPQDWLTEATQWSREQFSLGAGAELNKAQAETLKVQLEQWLLDEQAARAGAKA